MTTSNCKIWHVHSTLIFVQLTFGAFHVFGKYSLSHLHPLAVAGTRVAAAAPLLLAIAWIVDRTLPSFKDIPGLAMLGFLGVFCNQLLFILGLQYTTATNAGILMPSIPVFAAGFAIIARVERISKLRLVGIGLAVLGAVIMLDITGLTTGRNVFFGNALILTNCLSYALFLVLQKPMLKRLPPLTVIAWAFVFGGAGILLVSRSYLLQVKWQEVPSSILWAMAYVVLVPTVINYALNTWAIGKSSPAIVATYVTLQPVAGASLAMIVLGERAGIRELLGFVVIIAGLIIVSRVPVKNMQRNMV